jgi:phosphomannomutase
MNTKIFKAYDIRGLAPGELDEDIAYRVGQAVVRYTKAKVVVVGRDMRDTSPTLLAALKKGILSQSADVIDVGLMTTPMFYFAVGAYDLHDAGIMVTASHNPKEYNGFKLCYGDVLPIGGESGMWDIRDIALAGPYPAGKEGMVVETDIKEEYLNVLLSKVNAKKFRRINAVVDTANGMEGIIISDIFKRLPTCTMQGLFLDLDGNFPNHEANPLKEETLDALKTRVHEIRADIGIAFDGDGDRIGIVDDKGETVRGDILTALLAPRLLRDAPGTAVLYDVRESMTVAEEVERAGGRAVMCRVGHGLIKPQMRKEGAVFAGELSNHFYFRDFYGAESSDFVMLLLLEMLSETGKRLSELVAPLKRYFHSGEINFEVEDKEGMIAKLEEAYGHEATAISKLDGLRLEFQDELEPKKSWWFNVRMSNTEPLLRLNLEAKSLERMEEKRRELEAILVVR